MTPFAALDGFLQSWFHQDFDLDGDVPDIVAKFRKVAEHGQVDAIQRDIGAFLQQAGGDANAAFEQTFHPDITPAGWNMTAREWLSWLDRLLQAPPVPG